MRSQAGAVNIVGGGIAGLIAAANLAQAGVKVVLYEAAADLGGRARTRHIDGFSLNQGPHALYQGALQRELARLGVVFDGGKTNPHEPQALLRGKLHRLPTSAPSLAFTDVFSIPDKLTFARVQKTVMDGATGEGSFAAWLETQRLSSVVRAAMEALARVTSYANAPEQMSARAMLDQMRLGLKGVIYVDGGWASLVQGLAMAARDAGAVLNTGAAVERIVVEGRQSRVMMSDGIERAADATILAVGPKEATGLAPGVGSLRTYANAAIPIRANTLDLALKHLPEGARSFVLGVDQPLYFSVHSKAAKLAPEGAAVIHIARYLSSGETVEASAITELEGLADLAMPGWRDLEQRRQELRGMVVANTLVRWDQPRPSVALSDAPGLFIAGDWVGEEGMISDASAASAFKAARSALYFLSGTRDDLTAAESQTSSVRLR